MLMVAPGATPLLCVGPLAAVIAAAEYRRRRVRTPVRS